ncbi:hypothetical protein C2E20_5168 [Micractinium conductrix]|uniref:Uncharacterized protein n=1 Tax=Micractinium conductrix TaxID=554055 RepID=A0A2P6VBR0_9CHLO|nr:hypothetical protein C2E20_5168 [Micractinium conductrix]|eukprot:PSC71523.1 hypothetical protein C2E20_5168 [Micractinium conductrix]
MRRRRLALKRDASEASLEEDQHKSAQPAAQQHAGDGSWATDFAAEVTRAGKAAEPAHGTQDDQPQAAQPQRVFQRRQQRQQHHAQQQPQGWQQGAEELDVVLDSGDEGGGHAGTAPASLPASPLGEEEARQGLLKVVDSMRRRVDAGHLQLEAARRLRRQKQALLARGEAVLAEHCAASWRHPAAARGAEQPGSVAAGAVVVHSLQAECAAGQWWLHADVSLPRGRQQGGRLSLLATSAACRLACRQHLCVPTDGGDGGDMQRLRLTAALDVQQQQELQQGQQALQKQQGGAAAAGTPWADVFLLAEQAAGGGAEPNASLLEGPAAAPPVPLDRVQLSWQVWLRSHGRPPAAAATQQQQQQQRQQADPPAAAVRITPHGPQFAEVELRAGSTQLLDALHAQLAQGLHHAAGAPAAPAAAAGAPPGSVRLEGSLLAPGSAAAVSGAAESLVAELDACINWVEALLKQKLVLDGTMLRPGGASAPGVAAAEAQRRQAAALTAMAATDARLVSLLD